tara:strand:+ start:131 stop:325 length:195 start_codon:yes stop_codon:yes gene_type:complete
MDNELVIYTSMSQCIVALATAHDGVEDEAMKNIVHDAALICLSIMSPQDKSKADLMAFDGGKLQ